MLASHVALFGSTGSPEMFVFHALSAGNIGQAVPGSVVPLGAGVPGATSDDCFLWAGPAAAGVARRPTMATATVPVPTIGTSNRFTAGPSCHGDTREVAALPSIDPRLADDRLSAQRG